jgi:hypothetical protein
MRPNPEIATLTAIFSSLQVLLSKYVVAEFVAKTGHLRPGVA